MSAHRGGEAVLVQTLRRCIGLGFVLFLGSSTLRAREVEPGRVSIVISVYDDAGVGLNTMTKAEQVRLTVWRLRV